MKNKLWGGRFKKKIDPFMEKFTSSIACDKRLAEFDCLGSIAHAQMLGKCRIIPKKDSLKIVKGLGSILRQIKNGSFKYSFKEEDIHTALQNALYKKIGTVAEKLHTARSRNDQVVLDTRMYCKKNIDSIVFSVKTLKKAFLTLAKKNKDVIVPGFTHLQNAQPVLFSHQALAYCQMFDRDVERLLDCKKRVDVLPLGSCALSGTSLPIDRKYVAGKLGFAKVSQNSMDAVSDRDFVIELVFVLSLIAMHLSRISEDFIIWNSQSLGLLEIGDEFSTGSSMMPQKKNPDVLELIRGKCGKLYGSLIEVLTMMKALPLTYNRDMQEDKPPLFSAVETIDESLEMLRLFLKGLTINKDRAKELLKDEFLYATDIMEYLVKKGVSLKEAHDAVGRLVNYCCENDLKIQEISLRVLRSFNKKFNKNVYDLLDAKKSVKLKTSYGGTSPVQVKRKLKHA
ncbi:MAG: argininosuccinate lyase [Candidatus Omnitrophota bacterium]|jgi:argininosuccinate lyase|nr:argininosuccinate lyase [Candidatus Omnitrophota bacterium]